MGKGVVAALRQRREGRVGVHSDPTLSGSIAQKGDGQGPAVTAAGRA